MQPRYHYYAPILQPHARLKPHSAINKPAAPAAMAIKFAPPVGIAALGAGTRETVTELPVGVENGVVVVNGGSLKKKVFDAVKEGTLIDGKSEVNGSEKSEVNVSKKSEVNVSTKSLV